MAREVRIIGGRCAGGEAVLVREGADLVLKVPGRTDELIDTEEAGRHKVRIFSHGSSGGISPARIVYREES